MAAVATAMTARHVANSTVAFPASLLAAIEPMRMSEPFCSREAAEAEMARGLAQRYFFPEPPSAIYELSNGRVMFLATYEVKRAPPRTCIRSRRHQGVDADYARSYAWARMDEMRR